MGTISITGEGMSDFRSPDNYDGELREEIIEEVKEPSMYRVVLHNDHYTTMEFVVDILKTVFHKVVAEATKIMLDVHNKGAGIVGVFTYDVAATKISQVQHMAESAEFPLRCSMEKV